MSTSIDARMLAGTWSGRNLLWLGPGEPVRESATEATVTTAAANAFLVLAYPWSDQGKQHDGVIMARDAAEPGPRARRPPPWRRATSAARRVERDARGGQARRLAARWVP